MSQKEQTLPEGTILREDGCVCPDPSKAKKNKCDKISTCPYDPRFPNANQTKHCYVSFIDYQRCARLLGDYPGCAIFYRCYKSLCPISWLEEWFSQLEKGTFPRRIYPPTPIVYPDDEKMCGLMPEDEVKKDDSC